MITTDRKAQIIRNGILSRLPQRAQMEGEYNLTPEEADFLWACINDVDAVIARIIEAVNEGERSVAEGIDGTTKLPRR